MKCMHRHMLVDLPEAEAKRLLHFLAKKFKAKFNTREHYTAITGEFATICGYIDTSSIHTNKLSIVNDDLHLFFFEEEMPFYRRNKHRLILTGMLNAAANGHDVVFGSNICFVIVPQHTTLEQLLVEADLAA